MSAAKILRRLLAESIPPDSPLPVCSAVIASGRKYATFIDKFHSSGFAVITSTIMEMYKMLCCGGEFSFILLINRVIIPIMHIVYAIYITGLARTSNGFPTVESLSRSNKSCEAAKIA
jgi:hypothetical protein